MDNEAYKRVVELHKEMGWGRYRIAEALHLHPSAVKRALQKAKREGKIAPVFADSEQYFKHVGESNDLLKKENAYLRSQLKSMSDTLKEARSISIPELKKGDVVVPGCDDEIRIFAGDLHGSFMLQEAVAAFLEDVKILNPHVVVLLGDMLECGGFLAQNYTLGFVAEATYTFEEDVARTNWFLNELQERAPRARIIYIEGNHEHRIEKWCVTQCLRNKEDAQFLLGRFGPQAVLALKERGIEYVSMSEFQQGLSIRGTVKLGTDEVPVFATHGITACKHAAAKHVERFAANVVYGHTHRDDSYTINTVSAPVLGAWSPGCLCQRQRLWNHTQPDNWSHGYSLQVAAKSGLFQHTNVKISRGKSLLRPLLYAHTQG